MTEQESTTSDQEIWHGHPSQWTAFMFYLGCFGLVILLVAGSYYASGFETLEDVYYYPALAIPLVLLAVLIKYFIVRTKEYRLTTERLLVESGILTRNSEEIELYRVRDWAVHKPFWLRIVGRGHVRVLSTDATAPDLYLTGIAKPEKVRELIRTNVENARDKKRVRHVDIDGGAID